MNLFTQKHVRETVKINHYVSQDNEHQPTQDTK